MTIKKHAHIADIKSTTTIHPIQLQHVKAEVNLVHAHDTDNFKYSPTATEIIEPDTSSIQMDPDNMMPPNVKKKFLKREI